MRVIYNLSICFATIGFYIAIGDLTNSPPVDWKFGLLILGLGLVGFVVSISMENRQEKIKEREKEKTLG
jgi:pilus assembly protein TadC